MGCWVVELHDAECVDFSSRGFALGIEGSVAL